MQRSSRSWRIGCRIYAEVQLCTRAFSFLPMARIVAKVAAPAAPARNRGRGRAAPRAISPVNAHDATRSRQGGVMATYFIFGAVGQCPACADHRFSGPAMLAPEASLSQVRPRVYHKDRHRNRARVGRREEAQRPPRGSRKLKSDHGFVGYRTYQAAGGRPWLRDKCAAIRSWNFSAHWRARRSKNAWFKSLP